MSVANRDGNYQAISFKLGAAGFTRSHPTLKKRGQGETLVTPEKDLSIVSRTGIFEGTNLKMT